MPEIPIVGQVMKVLQWYPTVLVTCSCRAEQNALTIVIVTGLHNPSQCPHCRRLVQVAGFKDDGQGGLQVLVDIILPTPTGQVQ